jgi:anti-anti-sigma factor
MDITLGMVGETPIFALSGRLDTLTSPSLEQQLQPLLEDAVGGDRAVFDCADLSYVSSAGLRVFLLAQRRLGLRGGGIAFARVTQPVLELFRLAGLDSIFPIAGSAEEAAAKIAA